MNNHCDMARSVLKTNILYEITTYLEFNKCR